MEESLNLSSFSTGIGVGDGPGKLKELGVRISSFKELPEPFLKSLGNCDGSLAEKVSIPLHEKLAVSISERCYPSALRTEQHE